MYKTLLVPIDGSRDAREALSLACQLRQTAGGSLHLLHVPEIPPAGDWLGYQTGASPLDYTPEKTEAQGREILEDAWRGCDQAGEDDKVDFIVRQGGPVQVILAEAERLGADVIVMGSRGLSDLRGLVTGSVSHKISHLAPCNVITIHAR